MPRKLISTNPAKNYEAIGEVNISTKEKIKEKVDRAQKTKLDWKQTSLEKRISYFKKLIPIYKKRGEEIAQIQTKEVGKPIKESREDVKFDLFTIENNIRIAKKVLKPKTLDKTKTQKNVLYFEPQGVIAVITPWNFPSSNFFISCTQPLLAGNTIIFKHSEECPLTGKILEEIMKEAGFPNGVFSQVYGNGKVGDMLTNQNIDAIHFTSSTKTGRYLYEKAASKFIPTILEMGGSSPGIIFRNADLDKACTHACAERFLNCGQVCCALKRLIVHQSVYNEVIKKTKKIIENMKVGDPLDEKTDIGPLVAKRQLDLLIAQVKDAKNKGATVITGGNIVNGLDGAFYQPTILTNLTTDMKVLTEEVFGPILPIIPFKTEEEAVEIANRTIYGLSAFIYGKDLKQLKRVASKIDTGQISINSTCYFSDNSPFGGYKMSGIGRNSGEIGFHEVTQKKVVSEPVGKK